MGDQATGSMPSKRFVLWNLLWLPIGAAFLKIKRAPDQLSRRLHNQALLWDELILKLRFWYPFSISFYYTYAKHVALQTKPLTSFVPYSQIIRSKAKRQMHSDFLKAYNYWPEHTSNKIGIVKE